MIRSRTLVLLTLLAGCAAAPGYAQTSGTNTAPAKSTTAATAPAQQSSSATAAGPPVAFQARANLVVVDVVVTYNGAAVHGLPKDRFQILENGVPQKIAVFEEHRPEDALTVAKAPALPPDTYSDFPQFTVTSAANVLLLDALNTPLRDQMYVRQQMVKYLKNIPPGTRIAVFTLASRLRIVEGFTTDSSVIARALSGKGGPQQSVMLDTETDQQLSDQANDMAALGASQDAMSSIQQFQADLTSFQTDLRVRMTLDAMKNLARYLSVIPGRKNLIWFSGSFPLAIDPDNTLQSPFEAMRSYSQDVQQTDDMLSEARVAVYPVDARGLMPLPSTLAANSYTTTPAGVSSAMSGAGSRGGRSSRRSLGGGSGSSMPAAAKADQKFLQQTVVEHATMQQIAQETGGEAFMDTNGLKEAVAQAIANGSSYYTIAYVPQIKKYDGAFHHVKVTVDGGYQTAYRRGYYADDPSKAPIHSQAIGSQAIGSQTVGPQADANVMLTAVERGAPPMSELLFKVRVLAADAPEAKDVKVALGPAGATVKDLKGPLKRYLVDYAVDAHPIEFVATPDGLHHARVEFAAVAYTPDGKRLNYVNRIMTLDLPSSVYEQVLRTGLPAHEEIDLPAGRVYLRIVVQDMGSTRVGATEIPVMVAKR